MAEAGLTTAGHGNQIAVMSTRSRARMSSWWAVLAALAIVLVATVGWPTHSSHAHSASGVETPCTGGVVDHEAPDGADCTGDCCHVCGPPAALPLPAAGIVASRHGHRPPLSRRRPGLGNADLLRPPRA